MIQILMAIMGNLPFTSFTYVSHQPAYDYWLVVWLVGSLAGCWVPKSVSGFETWDAANELGWIIVPFQAPHIDIWMSYQQYVCIEIGAYKQRIFIYQPSRPHNQLNYQYIDIQFLYLSVLNRCSYNSGIYTSICWAHELNMWKRIVNTSGTVGRGFKGEHNWTTHDHTSQPCSNGKPSTLGVDTVHLRHTQFVVNIFCWCLEFASRVARVKRTTWTFGLV